ncbi:MAG: hypothetical protein HY741_07690 [Chloroflexi bacterium]|nr:hypothetical protein [Chloroflexota bacterium]
MLSRTCIFFGAAVLLFAAALAPAFAQRAHTPRDLNYQIFLPLVTNNACGSVPGETYHTLAPNPPPTDRPAEQHADLNLALRGYASTNHTLGLVDYSGAADARSPQLYTLFGDQRVPIFSGVAQVYAWDWDTNSRGDLITNPPVTLAVMQVAANEILHVPASGYNIGTRAVRLPEGFVRDMPGDDPNAYEVLVLYATPERITLKYTREDNVIRGYAVHVENVCVAPELLALYRQWNDAGRAQLPALKAGQAFGRALHSEIGVVIRDNGTFLDPRSRKDWWQGK